jgi:hypothetical protein
MLEASWFEEERSAYRFIVDGIDIALPDSSLVTQSEPTADQLKIKVLDIIDDYFKIENWDFGQTFYVTELITVIHKSLPLDIESIVLVPTFPINYFGTLFVIESGEDEILHSAATIADIQIIEAFDKTSLRQK